MPDKLTREQILAVIILKTEPKNKEKELELKEHIKESIIIFKIKNEKKYIKLN
jgi:hypothetical protein